MNENMTLVESLERLMGRGVVDGWKEINRVIDALEKLKKYDA